jgi:hypothetical protein
MNLSFAREPAVWLGLIQAGLALGVGFGLHVTTEQMGLIMAFAAAVAAVVIRQNVYAPVDKAGNPIAVSK